MKIKVLLFSSLFFGFAVMADDRDLTMAQLKEKQIHCVISVLSENVEVFKLGLKPGSEDANDHRETDRLMDGIRIKLKRNLNRNFKTDELSMICEIYQTGPGSKLLAFQRRKAQSRIDGTAFDRKKVLDSLLTQRDREALAVFMDSNLGQKYAFEIGNLHKEVTRAIERIERQPKSK